MSAEVPHPAPEQDSRSLRRDLYRQAALGRAGDYAMAASIIPVGAGLVENQLAPVIIPIAVACFASELATSFRRASIVDTLWAKKEKDPEAFINIGIDPESMRRLPFTGGLIAHEKSNILMETDEPIPASVMAQKIADDLGNMVYLAGPIRHLKYRAVTTGRVLVTKGKEDTPVRPLPLMLRENIADGKQPDEKVFYDSIKMFLKDEGWKHILPEFGPAGLVLLKRILRKMENNPRAADLGVVMALERVQKFKEEVKRGEHQVTVFDAHGKVA